ncbi:unnamed protein product [Rotaria sordida]|uniref:OTU domain-containing protein n=1 Tax=Rotaria sordida TaxID=392033 RepID=A0A819ZCN5_9BILA|nr:unnamed protein product [Rotaria sordida]
MDSIMRPFQFYPTYVFDEAKHKIDVVAKEYLQKASDDTHHLVPIDVPGDGHCLYHSIVLLMNNPLVTATELRVRTVIELITNENYYDTMYSQHAGTTDIIIQAACRKGMYSELHEIAALCNAIWDSVFTPIPPVIGNCNIAILWSNTLHEKDARETYNDTWRPNHFVPLLSPPILNEFSSQSVSLVVTPEKKTFKNNAVTQIRVPEFQSSLSRRLRSEDNSGNDFVQTNVSSTMEKEKDDKEERRQIQLQKKSERSRSSRMNETEEHRQIRLQKEKERSRASRMTETEEQRQVRLEKMDERNQSSRANESEEQRQIRLEKMKETNQSSRANESEGQRQIRLEKMKERNQSSRANESEGQRQTRLEKKREQTQRTRTNESREQHQILLEQQKKRSQANRTKKKHENVGSGKNYVRSPWPEPIARDLKETRLQQFLEQMSMSKLAEATCAVCNVRTPAKDAKKIPISKIPNIDLLKASEELKTLIKNSTENTATLIDDNNTHTTSHIKSM